MGAVVNGNVWAGACVNGKVVNGLVKNGVVFYRKEIPTPSVYKRRIMVGDNLTGKTLYADFGTSDYDYIAVDGENIVVTMVGGPNYMIYEDEITFVTPHQKEVYLQYYTPGAFLNLTSVPFIIMTSENEKTKNSSITIITDENDRSVTAVDENYTYRKIFIEDPNIRPIEVGDIITENTKFYFNVPDDFYLQEPSPGIVGKRVNVIVLNNGLHQFMLRSYDDEIYTAFYINTARAEEGNMYEYNRETGVLVKNTSMIVGPHRTYQNMHFEGTVTSVAKDSTIYPYILVDTTTLGA